MKKAKSEADEILIAIANHIGKLYALSIIQARASTDLALAVKAEAGVSQETKERADRALSQIDRMIEILKDVSNHPLSPDLTQHFEESDE